MELTPEEVALIEKHREKKKIIEFRPRSLSEISVEEKVQKFEELYALALGAFLDCKKKGYFDEDFAHYAEESVMMLLSKDIWNIIQEIEKQHRNHK